MVFQTRAIFYNIFEGLFWFLVPASLVVCNDCFAYFSGLLCGRRFIQRPFLRLSPNKTWEGFIGAGIATCVFSWFWPLLLSQVRPLRGRRRLREEAQPTLDGPTTTPPLPTQFHFLCCPYGEVDCVPNPVFDAVSVTLPDSLIQAQQLVLGSPLARTLVYKPVQVHCLFLAIVASVVAPFGGFFASGIKRAYAIKVRSAGRRQRRLPRVCLHLTRGARPRRTSPPSSPATAA